MQLINIEYKNIIRGEFAMKNIKNIVLSAFCLGLCFVLPFFTGQIPQIGRALAPMHIPVLICGLLCGWKYGLLIGFLAPLLRSYIIGMPQMYPTAMTMAFEMAAYGALSGTFVHLFPHKNRFIYLSLILSMFLGRIIWGISSYILLKAIGEPFPFSAFIAGAFIHAIPGIICHILLIPPIVIGVKKTLFSNESL